MALSGIFTYLWKGDTNMIKVLIAEDDPMVREINEKFLKKLDGFTLCSSVNSIEKAKKAVLECQPDLVLLDVFFPQGKGIDLLKWIRNENINCDVILITADRSTETVEESFRYGAVDYLVKPFVFNRFKEALLNYKNRKSNFQNTDILEQEMIDKYTLKEENLKNRQEIDINDIKGFNEHTYKKILKGIKDMNGRTFTAAQIAQSLGVSRITARRYLDYLEKENVLTMEMEYGKVGRPKNKYRFNKPHGEL